MKKRVYNFKKFKEWAKKDLDEIIFFSIFLFLEVYLFLNSKKTFAVVTLIIYISLLVIYRKYFKKIDKIRISKTNKKYYDFFGKLLHFSILLSFFITYSIRLFRIMKASKEMSVALFYPRLILLITIVFLLLWSFYLLKKWTLNRDLLFLVISLIMIYETLILFVVNKIYGVEPSDSDIGFYLMSMFIVMLCFWMIYIDAKFNKKFKNEKKPKILFKRQIKR